MKNLLASLPGLLFAVTAFAHPKLEATTPAKGATVKESPKVVELKFSEDLEPAMSQITVTNAKTKKDVGEKAHLKAGSKNVLVAELRDLGSEPATFDVSWKAVSEDTHKMKGSFTFSVNASGK